MAMAGTDGASHAHFLLEAERYRYRLIQSLNHLHATQVRYHNDKEQRLGNDHWQAMPRFGYAPTSIEEQVARGVTPAVLPLAGWLLALSAAAVWVARRLEGRPA
jgi:ABC-2 type transport system permease protein